MARRFRLLYALVLMGGVFGMLCGPRSFAAAAPGGYVGIPYAWPSLLPSSPYHVPAAVAARFAGRYTLTAIDKRTRINSGSVYIERSSANSLIGLVQFYGYDTNGYETGWMAALSSFHPGAHNTMTIALFDESGQDLGDRLVVTCTTKGNLVGQILLNGQRYAISWQKL